MHPLDVEDILKTLTVVVDTKEQITQAFLERCNAFQRYERKHLETGDYTGIIQIGGDWVTLPVAVERKMNIGEICNNFCKQRSRFEREFERAKRDNLKLYILIECGSWEKIYSGYYHSLMRPRSLVASILTWLSRYNCQVLMCEQKTTGQLIWDILYYETRQYLLNYEGGG